MENRKVKLSSFRAFKTNLFIVNIFLILCYIIFSTKKKKIKMIKILILNIYKHT